MDTTKLSTDELRKWWEEKVVELVKAFDNAPDHDAEAEAARNAGLHIFDSSELQFLGIHLGYVAFLDAQDATESEDHRAWLMWRDVDSHALNRIWLCIDDELQEYEYNGTRGCIYDGLCLLSGFPELEDEEAVVEIRDMSTQFLRAFGLTGLG